MKFAVLTDTLCGWEDCWTEGDKPWRFDSREEAQAEIDEHVETSREELEDPYDPFDFRIVECDSEGNIK